MLDNLTIFISRHGLWGYLVVFLIVPLVIALVWLWSWLGRHEDDAKRRWRAVME